MSGGPPPLLETGPATAELARRWFCRLYGLAVVAHVVGNPPFGLDASGVVTLVVGFAALALILDPGVRWLMSAVAAGVLLILWIEAPLLSNHWLVMGMVAVAWLVAAPRLEPWEWFPRTGRIILLGFYSFAAFAKLNSAFFDPDVSCGWFYADQTVSSWGLASIPPGGAVALAAAIVTAAIEWAIPVLLIIPRARRVGVALGFVFHFLISLDLGQHFFDFTAVLFPLFALFLPDRDLARLERTVGRHRRLVLGLVAVGAVLVAASAAPPGPPTVWLVRSGVFWVWIPIGAVLVFGVVRAGWGRSDVRLRPADAAAVAVVVLVAVNGLSPYLEIKTATAFNMYSNLVTAGGSSNHLLVRRTLPLTDHQDELFEVVETDHPGLEPYVASDWVLTEARLRHRLADGDFQATVRSTGSGQVATLDAGDGQPIPVLAEKFLLFRAVDLREPARCQTAWLPAA